MKISMLQLEFLLEDETQVLKRELGKVKEISEKTRKSIFARHGELSKKYSELVDRLSILEKYICTPK